MKNFLGCRALFKAFRTSISLQFAKNYTTVFRHGAPTLLVVQGFTGHPTWTPSGVGFPKYVCLSNNCCFILSINKPYSNSIAISVFCKIACNFFLCCSTSARGQGPNCLSNRLSLGLGLWSQESKIHANCQKYTTWVTQRYTSTSEPSQIVLILGQCFNFWM